MSAMPSAMSDGDYQAKSDGDTLMSAHEIMNDGKRHKAAIKHIQGRHDAAKSALKMSNKMLHKRVKSKLAGVFGQTTEGEDTAGSEENAKSRSGKKDEQD
jgi:hypothetical protein